MSRCRSFSLWKLSEPRTAGEKTTGQKAMEAEEKSSLRQPESEKVFLPLSSLSFFICRTNSTRGYSSLTAQRFRKPPDPQPQFSVRCLHWQAIRRLYQMLVRILFPVYLVCTRFTPQKFQLLNIRFQPFSKPENGAKNCAEKSMKKSGVIHALLLAQDP